MQSHLNADLTIGPNRMPNPSPSSDHRDRDRDREGVDYFLRLHNLFSIVELARQSHSVIANHKTGKILITSSLSSQSPDFVTVHGQATLSVFC